MNSHHNGTQDPTYELHRRTTTTPTATGGGGATTTTGPSMKDDSMDFSSNAGSESYYHLQDGVGSSVTGQGGILGQKNDATETVHEMHLALLYLLSNPEEFKKALSSHPPKGVTTLSDWNAEYDEEEESVITSTTVSSTPLPYIVFADDAEVVLPQAHTASQLFGIEQVEGIELEAAGGIPALSQLFLRWLALMPGGDHLNIIDPPGLTVMRIAGGRYRVTAVHRVVWTWMNEFAPLMDETNRTFHESLNGESSDKPPLQVGDLVSLTIVDVFETDSQGKLLSYCPTFDNRAVTKTNQAAEVVRKSSSRFFSVLGKAKKALEQSEVNKRASAQLSKMGIIQSARSMAENVRHRVDEAVHQMNSSASSPTRKPPMSSMNPNHEDVVTNAQGFEEAMTAAAAAATTGTKYSPPSEDLADSEAGVPGEMGEI